MYAKLHPGLQWRIFHIFTSEDIYDFTDIMLDPFGVCSKHLQMKFLARPRKSSVILTTFRKCTKMFVRPSGNFWLGESQKCRYLMVYLYNKQSNVGRRRYGITSLMFNKEPMTSNVQLPIFLSRRFHRPIYFQFELTANSDSHRKLND